MSILTAVRDAFTPGGRCTPRSRSFALAASEVGALQQRLPRAETVETMRIVGSVGRAHEVDCDFRPVSRHRGRGDSQRFDRVLRAIRQGRELPAIQLYRIRDDYYVLDGHHRLAAAIRLGQLAVDAEVIEFLPSVEYAHAETETDPRCAATAYRASVTNGGRRRRVALRW